ncbi:MAG: hypothetical protein WC284_06355 [Candidimonas sp.]
MTIDLDALVLLPWKTTTAYLHDEYVLPRKIDFNDMALTAWTAEIGPFVCYFARISGSYQLCVFDTAYGDLPVLSHRSKEFNHIGERIAIDVTERQARTVGHFNTTLVDLRAQTFRPGQRIMIDTKHGDYYATVVDNNVIVDNTGKTSALPKNLSDVHVVVDTIGVNCNGVDCSWSEMVLRLYKNDDCHLIRSIYDYVVDHTAAGHFQGKSTPYLIQRNKNFK